MQITYYLWPMYGLYKAMKSSWRYYAKWLLFVPNKILAIASYPIIISAIIEVSNVFRYYTYRIRMILPKLLFLNERIRPPQLAGKISRFIILYDLGCR